jgi:hypothetical protein
MLAKSRLHTMERVAFLAERWLRGRATTKRKMGL